MLPRVVQYCLVAPLALVLSPLVSSASCGSASCPLDLRSLDPHRSGEPRGLRLQVGLERIDQDQPRHGTDDVRFQQIRRPDHDEIETRNRNLNLTAAYAFGRRWELSATLPVVHREHRHILAPGHAHEAGAEHDEHETGDTNPEHADPEHAEGFESWDFTEPGDVVVRAGFQPFLRSAGSARLDLGVGVRLPSGATDVRNDEGSPAEPSLQPGSGGLGLVLDAALHGRRGVPGRSADRPAGWFLSTSLRLYGRGERDYRFGPEWMGHAGFHLPLRDRLDLLGQAVVRWRGEDDAGRTGELVDATGGTWAYLSPGLRFELTEGLSLHGFWQLPVHQDVNAVQLTSDRNLMVGIGYRFRAFE